MLANHAPASNDSPQGDSDYETILTALTESARGRSFLQEYLLRNRSADTATLLTAIGRIEGLLKTRSLEPGERATETANEAEAETDVVPADIAEAEIAEAGTAAAGIAEIASFSVEVSERRAPPIEVLGPQSKAAPEPVEHAPPADRMKAEPRDPFADFYALSDEEKIALFT